MRVLRILLTSVFIFTSITATAVNIIRDAEIEEILTNMAKAIFKVAGLRQESAKVYVIKSKTINAFTIGNGYIFLSSGLLFRFKNPLHVLGILCHETGHLAGGHIPRRMSVMQQRSQNSLWAMLAGILGTVVTGSEEALALMLGYAITDERFYLKYSRGEELAADALAVTYLEKLGFGADVMIEAFDVFQRMDILNGETNLPIYISTHPKTCDRISALQKRAKSKTYKASAELMRQYNRVLVKLNAYLKKHSMEIAIPNDDYSKAIYFHRIGRSKDAIDLLKKLLETNPTDIFYQETLAQTLYEIGQLDESIKIYEKIHNNSINVLIRIDYANVLIEANKNIELAISILESAKYEDYFNSDIYRLLAKGYGKQKKEGLSMLLLAQEQMLLGNYMRTNELLICCLEKLDRKTESAQIKKAKYFKELLKRDYKEYLRSD